MFWQTEESSRSSRRWMKWPITATDLAEKTIASIGADRRAAAVGRGGGGRGATYYVSQTRKKKKAASDEAASSQIQ